MKKAARIYYRKDIRSDDAKYIGVVIHDIENGTVDIDITITPGEWLRYDTALTIEEIDLWMRYLVHEFSSDNITFKFGDVLNDEHMLDEVCKYHTGNIFMKIDTL